MTEEVFERVLEELRRISFKGRFSPYLMNEPLLDKRLPALIARARAALPDIDIFISSNGDALSVDLGHCLFDAGLDCLLINLYDRSSSERTRTEEVLADLSASLPDAVVIRQPHFTELISEGSAGSGKRIAVIDAADWTVDQLTNRAGNVPGAALPHEPLRASCYRPFQQLYVRYTGRSFSVAAIGKEKWSSATLCMRHWLRFLMARWRPTIEGSLSKRTAGVSCFVNPVIFTVCSTTDGTAGHQCSYVGVQRRALSLCEHNFNLMPDN